MGPPLGLNWHFEQHVLNSLIDLRKDPSSRSCMHQGRAIMRLMLAPAKAEAPVGCVPVCAAIADALILQRRS
jgi:hypothetical protein